MIISEFTAIEVHAGWQAGPRLRDRRRSGRPGHRRPRRDEAAEAWPRRPSVILIPPGGTRAYVALTGDNTVATIDLETLSEVGRLKTGRSPDGMGWLDTKR